MPQGVRADDAPTPGTRRPRQRQAKRVSSEALAAPLEYILDASREAIGNPGRPLERLIAALEPAKRVFLYGRGRSGFVARAFAVRLMHLGYATYVVGETITAPVQKDDVVILVSGSGTTYPVVMTAEIGRKLGATVVAVTADPDSEIARLSHIVLPVVPPKGNGDRAKYAPLGTLFETAAWLFFDALVALLMERLGESEEHMRERHATLE